MRPAFACWVVTIYVYGPSLRAVAGGQEREPKKKMLSWWFIIKVFIRTKPSYVIEIYINIT